MNLVSKEGPIVNTRDGVLVLSQGAGSHEELGADAISIAPYDLEGTSDALAMALDMPPAERRRRAAALRRQVEDNDITIWLRSQFEDLKPLVARCAPAETAAALSRTA
jgi:trehalose 6-phosphate synthase